MQPSGIPYWCAQRNLFRSDFGEDIFVFLYFEPPSEERLRLLPEQRILKLVLSLISFHQCNSIAICSPMNQTSLLIAPIGSPFVPKFDPSTSIAIRLPVNQETPSSLRFKTFACSNLIAFCAKNCSLRVSSQRMIYVQQRTKISFRCIPSYLHKIWSQSYDPRLAKLSKSHCVCQRFFQNLSSLYFGHRSSPWSTANWLKLFETNPYILPSYCQINPFALLRREYCRLNESLNHWNDTVRRSLGNSRTLGIFWGDEKLIQVTKNILFTLHLEQEKRQMLKTEGVKFVICQN